MPAPMIEICRDADHLARVAAERFSDMARNPIADRFSVALSGGSTPRRLFSLLAGPPYSGSIDWERIFFFWGDERCVPPDHPDSNYRMARETLLSRVPVPERNIHRIPADDPDHQRAAESYSATITQFFAPSPPRFDLVLLGMGDDGHTASLFPDTTALSVNDLIAVPNFVTKFDAWRITLTASIINSARNVIFLVSGADKATVLHKVIKGDHDPRTYPSQLIAPSEGRLTWLIDQDAASTLTSK